MLIRKQNFNITWQNCTYSIIFQISNLVWTANDSSKHNNLIKVSVSVQINTEKKITIRKYVPSTFIHANSQLFVEPKINRALVCWQAVILIFSCFWRYFRITKSMHGHNNSGGKPVDRSLNTHKDDKKYCLIQLLTSWPTSSVCVDLSAWEARALWKHWAFSCKTK